MTLARSDGARIGILVSHPIQYQAPWFRHLARHFDLVVYFMHRQDRRGQAAAGFGVEFEWDVDLLEGYRHEWLANVARRPGIDRFFGCDTPGLYDLIAGGSFDAFVVFGWNRKSSLQAVHACRRARVPVLMRGDSQLPATRSVVRSAIKYPAYRALLPRVDGHLFVGRRNREYLEHYGVPSDRLFFVPHCVDGRIFRYDPDTAAERRTTLRQAATLPSDAFVVLFVGKLIDKKRPLDFVRAIVRLRDRGGPPVHALLVGDGPLRCALEDEALRASDRVHFAGFRNQREIADCYRSADALVLPSDGRETWGVVVNEAMACGIPAIVGDDVGCRPDLIEEGKTGFGYPTGDVAALADRIEALHRLSRERAAEIRAALGEKTRAYSMENATAGLAEAVAAVQ